LDRDRDRDRDLDFECEESDGVWVSGTGAETTGSR